MVSARPLYHGVRRSVWDPETSRERIGGWGGPETVLALLCVAARRATRPNGEWGYGTRRHMLEPVRPEAVLPDRALCLPTSSHFLALFLSSSYDMHVSFFSYDSGCSNTHTNPLRQKQTRKHTASLSHKMARKTELRLDFFLVSLPRRPVQHPLYHTWPLPLGANTWRLALGARRPNRIQTVGKLNKVEVLGRSFPLFPEHLYEA